MFKAKTLIPFYFVTVLVTNFPTRLTRNRTDSGIEWIVLSTKMKQSPTRLNAAEELSENLFSLQKYLFT